MISSSRDRPGEIGWPYALATFSLLVPFFAAALPALGFAAGLRITASCLPVVLLAAALATAAAARAEGLRPRDLALALGFGALALAAATALGHLLLDLSYDGQAYHQSAVRQLAAGWNPLERELTPADTTHGLWLNHYVRAAELGAAVVVAFTGSLEAGKALGIALVVPATIFGLLALRSAGLRRGPATAAAVVATLNPIVVAQLATFYVDGELALVFACALSLAWMALRGRARTAPILLAAAVALLANVKFTATVYAGLLLAGYVAARLLQGGDGRRREAWAPAGLALAAALAIGWQPLVTNTVAHRHPFHPVAGPSRVDGQSGQTPYFRYRDPLRRLVQSTFSESNAARTVPVVKLPFVVRAGEVAAMAHPDVRVGGFGPLFGLALTLAALGAAALPWSGGGPAVRSGLAVAAGVLVTALVNPGAWWARFVPQLWIAVVVASSAAAGARRASRALGAAALVVLAADGALAGASALAHQVATQAAALEQARDLSRRYAEIELPRGEMESLDLRLARARVRARYVPACTPALPLIGTYAAYCADSPAARASRAF